MCNLQLATCNLLHHFIYSASFFEAFSRMLPYLWLGRVASEKRREVCFNSVVWEASDLMGMSSSSVVSRKHLIIAFAELYITTYTIDTMHLVHSLFKPAIWGARRTLYDVYKLNSAAGYTGKQTLGPKRINYCSTIHGFKSSLVFDRKIGSSHILVLATDCIANVLVLGLFRSRLV